MLGRGVVDQLNELFRLDPAVRVEDEAEHALLNHRGVEGRLPVVDGDGIVRLVVVLGEPVARRDAGELPAQLVDDERVRVVVDGVDEGAIGRQVLAKPLAAVGLQNQLARQIRVVGREQVEHRAVEREEAALRRRLVEDLREHPRAGRVE